MLLHKGLFLGLFMSDSCCNRSISLLVAVPIGNAVCVSTCTYWERGQGQTGKNDVRTRFKKHNIAWCASGALSAADGSICDDQPCSHAISPDRQAGVHVALHRCLMSTWSVTKISHDAAIHQPCLNAAPGSEQRRSQQLTQSGQPWHSHITLAHWSRRRGHPRRSPVQQTGRIIACSSTPRNMLQMPQLKAESYSAESYTANIQNFSTNWGVRSISSSSWQGIQSCCSGSVVVG